MNKFLAMAAVFLSAMTGCATMGSATQDGWPRISIEMRYMMVDESYLEEFGIELDAYAESVGHPASGAFVSTIDQVDANVLVAAALAQQNSLVLNMPRLTLEPGHRGRAWAGHTISFISDLEPDDGRPRGGGILFEIAADFAPTNAQGDPQVPSSVRLVLVGRALPAGVYREDDLRWVAPDPSSRSPGTVDVYPLPTLRVQTQCVDRATILIALPAPAPDAEEGRRTLLLIRPTIITSVEVESELFPGLEAAPRD